MAWKGAHVSCLVGSLQARSETAPHLIEPSQLCCMIRMASLSPFHASCKLPLRCVHITVLHLILGWSPVVPARLWRSSKANQLSLSLSRWSCEVCKLCEQGLQIPQNSAALWKWRWRRWYRRHGWRSRSNCHGERTHKRWHHVCLQILCTAMLQWPRWRDWRSCWCCPPVPKTIGLCQSSCRQQPHKEPLQQVETHGITDLPVELHLWHHHAEAHCL